MPFVTVSHFGKTSVLLRRKIIKYTRHIRRLIMSAKNPKIITKSLKNGKAITVPCPATGGFADCNFEKNANAKKHRLQMKVNLEKK